MTEKIRLLLATKSTGGVASYIRTLVKGLDKKTFAITVVCLSENGTEFARELVDEYGVQAFSLAMNRYKINPLTDLKVFFRLARHIRLHQYDLIHAHVSKPGFLMRLAAAATPIPVLYSPHNFAFHEGASPIFARFVAALERFAARFTTKIITVSSHERDLALHYGVGSPDLYVVVPSGIDAELFRVAHPLSEQKKTLNVPEDAPIVGVVGRLAEPKSPQDFVRMAALVHEKYPSVHFVWIGDGPLQNPAMELTSSLGLDDVVHWAGFRKDVPDLLSSFSCFVLPTGWEAFPLVVLEAFAADVPVVATDVMGTREFITHQKNGFLVPVGDVQGMAGYVIEILSNAELAERVRKQGRLQVDELYTLERMISSLTSIYKRTFLLSKRSL